MSLEDQFSPRPSLRHLPALTTIKLDPWQLITTKQLAHALGLDPACIATWTYRGIGPPQEEHFFRGSVRAFRVDRVQTWLAARRGEPYEQEVAWAEALWRTIQPIKGEVRALVRHWVQLLGPSQWAPLGCRWRPGGFDRYLESLCET